MGDCSCDPEEEFRQAQEALQKLAHRLADGRLRQISQKIKQQKKWDNAPRHTEYQGHNVNNGGLVKSLGGDAVARQPISNGWLSPGDVVEVGSKGGFDFKPRAKANEQEEKTAPEVCTPGTIYKFISLKGTTQYLPFKFPSLAAKPTEAQLKRIKTRWRLIEVGASGLSSVVYGTGYVKGRAFIVLSSRELFNVSNSSFSSTYDYPGYMQLQIGCFNGKNIIWNLKK